MSVMLEDPLRLKKITLVTGLLPRGHSVLWVVRIVDPLPRVRTITLDSPRVVVGDIIE